MKMVTSLLVLVFVMNLGGTALACKNKIVSTTGKLTFVCPQRMGLKMMVGKQELVLRVMPTCPRKKVMMAQIGKLKVEDEVTVSYFQSPETGKLFLTKITVVTD